MIGFLRWLWSAAWERDWLIRDATLEEDACESCETSLALHCTDRQAAECKIRLAAVGPGGGIRVGDKAGRKAKVTR